MNDALDSYSAHATHSAWADEWIAGTITVDPQNLVFRSDGIEVSIPLSRLIISADGTARWRFHDSENDEWTIETSDKQILTSYFFTYRHTIRNQVRELAARQEGLHRLRMAPLFLLLFFAIVAVVWLLAARSVNFLVSRIPASWERELGDELLSEIQSDAKLQSGTKLVAYLESLGNRLMPGDLKRKYPLRFYILDDPDVNAAALPGGIIIVNSGTLDAMRSPEQLAGILAHEIAHIIERHSLRKLVSSIGPHYALRLFIRDKSSLLSVLAHSSHILLRQNFSREYEREADATAWRLLVDARIDPRGYIEALRQTQTAQRRLSTGNAPRILSSHPPTDERIKHLENLWEKTSPKSGFTKL